MRNHALAAATAALILSAVSASVARAVDVDVDAMLRREGIMDVKVSPDGGYLAATLRLPDRTALTIIRRADGVRTANVVPDPRYHIGDFHWVSNERVLMMPRIGSNIAEDSIFTGEIIGMNVDNTLAGTVIQGGLVLDMSASRLGSRSKEGVFARLVDDLPAEDKRVIVSISPVADPYSRAEVVDSVTGGGKVVAKVGVPRASFTTDARGVVRFASGVDDAGDSKLFHRAGEDAPWQLLNDEKASGLVESALGFSADNAVAYLQVETRDGPDAIVAFDPATGTRKPVFRDAHVDPWRILRAHGIAGAPVGVMLMDGLPRTVFFDETSDQARLYRTLEAAFPGQGVLVTSLSRDGRIALVKTFGGNSPGDFHVFDRDTKRVEHVVGIRDWLDPAKMATVTPVQLKARDGQHLQGYLTRPAGTTGPLPMVVLVRPTVALAQDSPWGFHDGEFNDEAQMLAQAGYAVLQVNHRGSGGHGRSFRDAAIGKWSTVVPDDIADATRWAVAQGMADGERICVYGSRMGAHAALIAAARAPGLFKCAASDSGVFDLALMHRTPSHGDKPREKLLDRRLGTADSLSAVSAIGFAGGIGVPVYLASDDEGSGWHARQFRAMRSALEKADVETTVYRFPTSSAGDAAQSGRREHYTRLLDFLSGHLGGGKARPPSADAAASRTRPISAQSAP